MARLLRTKLDSSSIEWITYDPGQRVLEVMFRRTGHTYNFYDVPRTTYREFMETDSKGAFLNRVIKPNFEYVRVDIPL